MKFINKEKFNKLDKIVAENTSLRFQTRYDIIMNPENVSEAYFCVTCAYIPGMVNSGTVQEKEQHFNKLYADIVAMIKESKLEDTTVVAKYTPKDNPTVVEIYIDDNSNLNK